MSMKPEKKDFDDEKQFMRAYRSWWRETHREQDNETKRIWARDNKDYYSGYFRCVESIKCDCGGCYKPKDKNVHFKTKKHINFMEQLENASIIV
jgi:hypothetical protein